MVLHRDKYEMITTLGTVHAHIHFVVIHITSVVQVQDFQKACLPVHMEGSVNKHGLSQAIRTVIWANDRLSSQHTKQDDNNVNRYNTRTFSHALMSALLRSGGGTATTIEP